MAETEYRLNGGVAIEVYDLFVKLFWIEDIGNSARKAFKNNLLNEYKGRLIIDFRRKGGAIVMCDMVCVLQDEVDFEQFKTELVSDHERTRNGTATWKGNQNNQVVLKSAVGGELSVTFYSRQRKIMAQANPEPLFQFVKYFANTMNSMQGSLFTPASIVTASEQPDIVSSDMQLSQEIPIDNWDEAVEDASDIAVSNQQDTHDEDATDSELARLAKIEKATMETNEIIQRSTFADFQKITFQELRDIKENQKEILLHLPSIKELTTRMNELEKSFKSKTAHLSERVLLIEEERKNTNSSLKDAHENNRAYKASVNKLRADIIGLQDELSNIRADVTNKHDASHNCDSETIAVELKKMQDSFSNHVSQQERAHALIREELRELNSASQISAAAPAPMVHPPVSEPTKRPIIARPSPDTVDYVFNSEVIFVHDSNGEKVRADILHHRTSVQKVLAYTVPEAIEIFSRATFASVPRKIMLHIITNDVEIATNATQIEGKFTELLELLRVRCPDSEIFFSSVLPRRDLTKRPHQMNLILERIAASRPGCHMIVHNNISAEMLSDKKHLNKTGFFLFLANIRFVMFGKNSVMFRDFGSPNSI